MRKTYLYFLNAAKIGFFDKKSKNKNIKYVN